MLVVDPQGGATPLSLAGALSALPVPEKILENILSEKMTLQGGTSVRLQRIAKPSASGMRVFMDLVVEGDQEEVKRTTAVETLSILEKTSCASGDALGKTASVLDEMIQLSGEDISAGGEIEWSIPYTALASLAFFRFIEETAVPLVSLPVGICTNQAGPGEGIPSSSLSSVISAAAKYSIPIFGLRPGDHGTTVAAMLMLAKTALFTDHLPSMVPEGQFQGIGPDGTTIRVILSREKKREDVWLVEAALDDATGEEMGRALSTIQEASLEAHILQGIGKKGRPLFILRSLARSEQLDEVLDRFFRDTPTIGVRYWPVGRTRMHREIREGQLVVDGLSLPTRIKISRLDDVIKGKAESDDIAKHLKSSRQEPNHPESDG